MPIFGSPKSSGSSRSICIKRGCKAKAHRLHTENADFKYKHCDEHRCRVGWMACPEVRSGKTHYCAKHRYCGKSGCDKEGKGLQHKGNPYFCREHRCSKKSCEEKARSSSEFCKSHIPAPSPSPRLCTLFPYCNHAPDTDSHFCHLHRCVIRGCARRRHDSSDHCEVDHHKPAPRCSIMECERPRVEGGERCEAHHPCGMAGCNAPARWDHGKNESAKFCGKHDQCSAKSCKTVVVKDERHCREHRCAMDGCSGRKSPRGRWCSDHSCNLPGCETPIEAQNYAESQGPHLSYCAQHTCSLPSCNSQAKGEGSLCPGHSCRISDCLAPRHGELSLCSTHKCGVSECGEVRDGGKAFCAARHACCKPGCQETRASIDDKLCTLHYGDLRAAEEREKLTGSSTSRTRLDSTSGWRDDHYRSSSTRSRRTSYQDLEDYFRDKIEKEREEEEREQAWAEQKKRQREEKEKKRQREEEEREEQEEKSRREREARRKREREAERREREEGWRRGRPEPFSEECLRHLESILRTMDGRFWRERQDSGPTRGTYYRRRPWADSGYDDGSSASS